VAIFKGGQCVVDVAAGVMGPFDRRPVQPRSTFPLFGASRAVVACLAQFLAKSGRLALNATVHDHWSDFRANGKEFCTVPDLLRCRSGVEAVLPKKMSTDHIGGDKAADAESAVAQAQPRMLASLVRQAATEAPDADGQKAPAAKGGASGKGTEADAATGKIEEAEAVGKGSPARPLARAESAGNMAGGGDDDDEGEDGEEDEAPMVAFLRMPAGPRPPFESAAHLYFGWGWAAGKLISGAAG